MTRRAFVVPNWKVCHAMSQQVPTVSAQEKWDGGCHVLSHVHITRFRPHKIDCGTTRINSLPSIFFCGIPIGGYKSSLK